MLPGKRPTCGLVLLLLLAACIPSGVSADAGNAAGSVREVLHIDTGSSGTGKMFEAFDTANLNLYDVDGDGLPELISQNDNNRVYVIDPRRGLVLAELTTYFAGPNTTDVSINRGGDGWGARVLSGVAVGDVDRDGRTDLVVTNSASYLTRFSFVPSNSTPDRFVFEEKWREYVDVRDHDEDVCDKNQWVKNCTTTMPGMDGHPVIADVDGDGDQEIFVTTDDFPGHFSFTAEGEVRWTNPWFDGNAGPTAADLDGDNTTEVVYVTDGGAVVVYNANTSQIRWVFQAEDNGAWPGSISVSPTVVDVRGDGEKYVVVGARNIARNHTTSDTWVQDSHAIYYAIDRHGEIVWQQSFDWGNPHVYMHPAAADVDGDGFLDLIFMDWNTVGHKPGNWETTGRPTNLFALRGVDGTPIWRTTSNVFWSNKDIVVVDVGGDAAPEIVAADATEGEDALVLRELATGDLLGHVPLGDGWKFSRGPVAADLYGDGRLYLVVPVMKDGALGCTHEIDVGCREGALKIYATEGRVADAVWTNNVLFNADLDRHPTGTAAAPGNLTNRTDNESRNDTSPERTPTEQDDGTWLRIPAPAVAGTLVALLALAGALRRRRGGRA